MTKQPGIIRRFFSSCWALINTARKILVNLVFIVVIFAFIAILTHEESQVSVPNNSALLLDLNGDIVEQKVEIDPMDALFNEAFSKQEERPEVLLSDVIDVIDHAKTDDRIELIVLKLNQVRRAGLTKLQDIGRALSEFKDSGKQIIAVGDAYSQEQYYLASYADEIWLDPKGFLLLDGFGRYQLYFKSALEKLSVTQHVFRVGTYKSAVEPYIRDDMSDEAKAANKLWLNDLWEEYKADVAKQRGFELTNFDEDTNTLIEKFTLANGSFAEYAKQNEWVDQLLTRSQMSKALIEKVGENKHGDSFNQISYKSYRKAIKPPIENAEFEENKVAIVVAKGTILNGTQPPGTIGGDSTAKLLKKARLDANVKAVVLRVDSPGGSAYASEIIRQEIELIKKSGKPVVASMGSMAASGGYWISAPADKIVASPTTITGSIGIFGMLMTLENTLGKLGVYTDGVGTTEISGFGVTRPLSEGMSQLFQMSINRGYEDFISLVAENRMMTPEQVDQVAQGRVWSGSKAKELGLVDELGSLEYAVELAANLAEIESYKKVIIEKKPSAQDMFWRNFYDSSASWLIKPAVENHTAGPASLLIKRIFREFKQFDQFNDPQGIYSFCLTCEIN
ncbi:signal peptide peptidase SppA [Thalassotalea sp. M1531]|uniref:Signal peptide peptidase SppA n=1 Tax=Thalassotalea algicola TaxID=2716224 RepID=A0A7Y0Q8P0_9GAMM|nr:signal peptide peptidase SppA [Thalassotalea algicola]NMP32375.1 signal peptide peptidase SppA [Thalassotalea algicola]